MVYCLRNCPCGGCEYQWCDWIQIAWWRIGSLTTSERKFKGHGWQHGPIYFFPNLFMYQLFSGTVLAVELKVSDGGGYGSSASAEVVKKLKANGIFARPLGSTVYLMLTPTTTPEEAMKLMQKFIKALDWMFDSADISNSLECKIWASASLALVPSGRRPRLQCLKGFGHLAVFQNPQQRFFLSPMSDRERLQLHSFHHCYAHYSELLVVRMLIVLEQGLELWLICWRTMSKAWLRYRGFNPCSWLCKSFWLQWLERKQIILLLMMSFCDVSVCALSIDLRETTWKYRELFWLLIQFVPDISQSYWTSMQRLKECQVWLQSAIADIILHALKLWERERKENFGIEFEKSLRRVVCFHSEHHTKVDTTFPKTSQIWCA